MASSKIKLEIAAHSLYSSIQAQKGGADRIELCMALPTGGLTPSPGIIRAVRDMISIPIHVLIRPRLGDFEYNDFEMNCMVDSIAFCKSQGIDGVVIGCLQADQINLQQMEVLIRAAREMDVTFHRAFDLLQDPFTGLDQLIAMGFNRVLTSGLASSAWEGRNTLKKLRMQAMDKLTIMAGAGVNAANIEDLFHTTGCQAYHASGKRSICEVHADPLQITTIHGQAPARYESDWTEIEAMRRTLDGL